MNEQVNLRSYMEAATPAVAIATLDEDFAISQILNQFSGEPEDQKPVIFMIAGSGGLRQYRSRPGADGRTPEHYWETVNPTAQYLAAFANAARQKPLDDAGDITEPDEVLIVLDWQHLVHNAMQYRPFRDSFPALKQNRSMVCLVAPSWKLPPELERDVPVIELPLPSREELTAVLDSNVQEAVRSQQITQAPTDTERTSILDSLAGLTRGQAEQSLFFAVVSDRGYRHERLLADKIRLIKQSGLCQIEQPLPLSAFGGYGGLKNYINEELAPSSMMSDLRVRALILCGVQGTGKTTAARVIASILGRLLVRASLRSFRGSLQGDTEKNTDAFFKLMAAISPVVILFDEMDKQIGGHASSAQTDGGTGLGQLEATLTFMERDNDVLSLMTCNDYGKLPAELTRAGRVDERFFLDLPTSSERPEIAAVHLAKFRCPPELADHVAKLSADWSGAEIEQLIRSAARRTKRQPSIQDLTSCAADIKPLAKVKAEEVKALRTWGRSNLRLANTAEVAQATRSRTLKSA